MKKSTFKKLKPGDKVTVRTREEITKLNNVAVYHDGSIGVGDFWLFTVHMDRYSGKTYTVEMVQGSTVYLLDVDYYFTRKMLR